VSPASRAPERAKARRDGPRFERIVLLRVAAVVLVVAFLALIVRVAMIAFGSSERSAKRIDGAVERSLVDLPATSR
jgi:hypothetical protein